MVECDAALTCSTTNYSLCWSHSQKLLLYNHPYLLCNIPFGIRFYADKTCWLFWRLEILSLLILLGGQLFILNLMNASCALLVWAYCFDRGVQLNILNERILMGVTSTFGGQTMIWRETIIAATVNCSMRSSVLLHWCCTMRLEYHLKFLNLHVYNSTMRLEYQRWPGNWQWLHEN